MYDWLESARKIASDVSEKAAKSSREVVERVKNNLDQIPKGQAVHAVETGLCNNSDTKDVILLSLLSTFIFFSLSFILSRSVIILFLLSTHVSNF